MIIKKRSKFSLRDGILILTNSGILDYTLFLLVALFCLPTNKFVYSQEYAKSDEIIIVKGIGKVSNKFDIPSNQMRLNARRAAIVDAYRNALVKFKEYDERIEERGPVQIIHLSGSLKGATILETVFRKDGWVEVRIAFSKNMED